MLLCNENILLQLTFCFVSLLHSHILCRKYVFFSYTHDRPENIFKGKWNNIFSFKFCFFYYFFISSYSCCTSKKFHNCPLISETNFQLNLKLIADVTDEEILICKIQKKSTIDRCVGRSLLLNSLYIQTNWKRFNVK